MGCTQSKIENEESVTRCKERKLNMEKAVAARNAFAATHSGYQMSLKNTGAALSDYAHGEVQNTQFSPSANPAAPNAPVSPSVPAKVYDNPLPPPPPPVPNFSSPLQRAATMPEIKIPNAETKTVGSTIEEGNENEAEGENEGSVSGGLHRRGSRNGGRETHVPAEETGDPSPSPPPPQREAQIPEPLPQQDTPYEYFFPSVENMPGPNLSEVEPPVEVKNDKEEIEREQPGPSVERVVELPPPPTPGEVEAEMAAGKKKVKQGVGGGALGEGKRVGKGSVNLLQIFADLDERFLRASESAYEVSRMLEATRLHYHSNFADNRGHIDHSARVLQVITWNRSFRGLRDLDVGKDDFDSEENETHATVLDKLLAWEKKLYDEVKAGELMKIEYQKKVALLNKQRKRGTSSEALEKTKAAVSHLHTRYIVDMQSMDSTVSEINRLRDDQLYPKLVHLVDGMATMWEDMKSNHEQQSKIVMAIRALDISQSSKETTEHHHERTVQLWAVLRDWHSQFVKLMENQKEYIKALNNWLRLNLIPIESSLKEKVSSPPRIQAPPIQYLLHAWHDHLEHLQDELPKTAISNFLAVVETIISHQEDEIKQKEKCAETRKELDRKQRQFSDWYNKYSQRRMQDEEQAGGDDNAYKDIVAERQFMVETVNRRLEDEKEAYKTLCRQVREKSLASLKTHLPDLFRALFVFAASCSEMYKNLRTISQSRNSTGSLP